MSDKHNGESEQSPPPLVQKLPNECLYLIVNHLWDDLPTLHILLSVNRFFFHAAILKIMDQPLNTWEMDYCYQKFPTNREKLFVLVLASLLHYQRQITGQDVSSILKEYGLQLVPSTEFELLQPFFTVVRNDNDLGIKEKQQQQQPEKQEKQIKLKNPMTLDYSKFFTILNSYHWKYVEYHRFIRLIEMPVSLRAIQETLPGFDEIGEPTTLEQDEHATDIQEDQEYKDLVREAITQMLFHYNIDSITEFSLHVSEARKYLPMAAKLAKLKVLNPHRDDSLPDQHLQDTIAFIHLHQSSFPGKPCLQLRFDYQWSGYNTTVFTSIKESRSSSFSKMKSKLELYKAIGEPEDLEIGYIPGFYGQAGDIGTGRLLQLDDEDEFRIDMSEGADMEAFLRRCRRLETLGMRVGHPHMFSWAAQHARDHADGQTGHVLAISTDILPRLNDLSLWSDRPYRFSIYTLNDSMVAFAKSLGKVSISNNHEFRNRDQNTNPWNSWILQKDDEKSRMIRTSPLANKIGDWPFPFPKLKSLTINLRCTSYIQIGSLDQCFNLEELDLRYGSVGEAPRAVGPNDDDPTADPRRQALLDPSLYPKWTLPKLKTLHLDGVPALLFNYDSLEGMPNLEKMTLSCRKKVDMEERLMDIPRLSLHSSSFCSTFATQESTPAGNSDLAASTTSDDSAQFTSTSSKGTIWTRTWTLPKLKTLEMDGPPATVFTFDWLKGCPSLKSVALTLNLYGSPQRLPLIAHSPATYVLSRANKESGTKFPQNNTQASTTAVTADADTGVFMESSLESLHLKGPWEITASDLTVLITDNAPFLKTLSLNKVQSRGGVSATAFVQAFKDVDEICRRRYGKDWDALPGDVGNSYDGGDCDDEAPQEDLRKVDHAEKKDDADNGARPESDVSVGSQASAVETSTDTLPTRPPLPGRSLLTIETDYTIGKRHRLLTELEHIDSKNAEDYRRCGIRVFSFSKLCVVDKYDQAWYTRNKGSEWWAAHFK